MNIRESLFTINGLILCLLHTSLFLQSDAAIEILNFADLCNQYPKANLNLRFYNSSIVRCEHTFLPECEIKLNTFSYNYVVISFYQYNIQESESLIFRDEEGTELSLFGKGTYDMGEKSFIFKGPLTIEYVGNSTYHFNGIKFEFTFTEVHDPPCRFNEFQCSNNKCIKNHLVCDGHNSCGDLSDERDCVRYCDKDEFECKNGRCVSKYKVCDGRNDCGDRSDEMNCDRPCTSQEFQCLNKKCISGKEVCDARNNCGDLSDEKDCFRRCSSAEFTCSNGKCIPSYQVCNRDNNCGDLSDENNCNRFCLYNEFRCRNSKCISKFLKCDKKNDCGDNSDESDCSWRDTTMEPIFKEKKVTLIVPIIVGVVAGIGLIGFIVFVIVFCVKMRKKQQPANSLPGGLQRPPPSSVMGRMRQSFRSLCQPTAPPLEMVSETESVQPESQQAPSVLSRIRQSFRSNRQPTVQPENTTTASDLRSQNTEVPTMYPHLPPEQETPGVDNQGYKAAE